MYQPPSGYVMPGQLGSEVEVANDLNWSDVAFGRIVRMKATSCAIEVVREGHRNIVLPDCRHESDPSLKDKPLEYWKDSGTGVFRLTSREVRVQRGIERVPQLESTVAILKTRLDAMESALQRLSAQNTSNGPRRGRPPKQKQEDSGEVAVPKSFQPSFSS